MPTVNQNAFADRPPVQKTLLRNVTGLTTGQWFRLQKQRPISLTVEGTFVAQIRILVSNDEIQPLDTATNYPTYGADFFDPQAILIDGCFEWIKAYPVAYTSGSINCFVIVG